MGETQTPRDDLSDLEHLRTLSTPKLRRLFRTTKRSRDELIEWHDNIAAVLKERG